MDILLVVLVVTGIVTCCVAMFVMVRADRAVAELRDSVRRTEERLAPLVEKADVAVDAINAELLRVDGIVSQFEAATDKVSSTARAAHDAVEAPMRIVAGAGEGIARLFSALGRRRG